MFYTDAASTELRSEQRNFIDPRGKLSCYSNIQHSLGFVCFFCIIPGELCCRFLPCSSPLFNQSTFDRCKASHVARSAAQKHVSLGWKLAFTGKYIHKRMKWQIHKLSIQLCSHWKRFICHTSLWSWRLVACTHPKLWLPRWPSIVLPGHMSISGNLRFHW